MEPAGYWWLITEGAKWVPERNLWSPRIHTSPGGAPSGAGGRKIMSLAISGAHHRVKHFDFGEITQIPTLSKQTKKKPVKSRFYKRKTID